MSEEGSEDATTASEASFSEESESDYESDIKSKRKKRTYRKKLYRFDKETMEYGCMFCKKICETRAGIYKHLRKCTNYMKETEKERKIFTCTNCKLTFRNETWAIKHIRRCSKDSGVSGKVLHCQWCNLQFKNRGNLALHAYHLHGDTSYKMAIEKKKLVQCPVCQYKLSNTYLLKYHIRKMHYNLKARRPYADLKKVNQVWFEKVLNSNIVIEIKKTGRNKLVMRKLDEGTSIKVKEINTETIDLSHIYPTEHKSVAQAKVKATCDICKGVYSKKDIAKHTQEVHMNLKKHHCNNCNRSFKRSYQFIQHLCYKTRKVGARGVYKEKDSTIQITSVESLHMPRTGTSL